jgi:hypothetical protein
MPANSRWDLIQRLKCLGGGGGYIDRALHEAPSVLVLLNWQLAGNVLAAEKFEVKKRLLMFFLTNPIANAEEILKTYEQRVNGIIYYITNLFCKNVPA